MCLWTGVGRPLHSLRTPRSFSPYKVQIPCHLWSPLALIHQTGKNSLYILSMPVFGQVPQKQSLQWEFRWSIPWRNTSRRKGAEEKGPSRGQVSTGMASAGLWLWPGHTACSRTWAASLSWSSPWALLSITYWLRALHSLLEESAPSVSLKDAPQGRRRRPALSGPYSPNSVQGTWRSSSSTPDSLLLMVLWYRKLYVYCLSTQLWVLWGWIKGNIDHCSTQNT